MASLVEALPEIKQVAENIYYLSAGPVDGGGYQILEPIPVKLKLSVKRHSVRYQMTFKYPGINIVHKVAGYTLEETEKEIKGQLVGDRECADLYPKGTRLYRNPVISTFRRLPIRRIPNRHHVNSHL